MEVMAMRGEGNDWQTRRRDTTQPQRGEGKTAKGSGERGEGHRGEILCMDEAERREKVEGD